MKKITAFLVVLYCVLALLGCSTADKEGTAATVTDNIALIETSEATFQNEILNYFADKYNMMFRLWGPEGQDLYAFYIYPDYAERECHILMPANTADVSEYHKNLSWKVVDNELIIAGEWQETFTIDISAETATSTATGKVYTICDVQPPLE